MTLYSLAAKDLKKAQISLEQALKKPGVSLVEINNLEQLVFYRQQIFDLVGGKTNESKITPP